MDIPAAPDPYREGNTPFLLDGTPTDEFEAFREMWRRGAPLDNLHPDGPFALRDAVGPYKPNRQGDVEALLHDTGHLDANETDGPTGIYSRALLDVPIHRADREVSALGAPYGACAPAGPKRDLTGEQRMDAPLI